VTTVFVPGFTQTAASWAPVIERLRQVPDPVAVDVPSGLDFASTAHAIGDAGPAAYVGYSMGGRLCLRLALDRPEVVGRLVLVSASPGIADARERAARRAADEELAVAIERGGIETFLEQWLAQPMFSTLPRDAAALDDRKRGHTVESLTHALRALGQGAQEPLWARLSDLTMPVLLVAGNRDEKYVAIARAMADAIDRNASVRLCTGVGHAAHLEDPNAVAAILDEFHGRYPW
jgi:2-succinyl-6-hydroxy-2,4-cyclohexadiene-1-carboxylate synthase